MAAAGVSGDIATRPNLAWYADLAKPIFTPPHWILGPIWTILYALMAYGFWRILQMRLTTPGRRTAIIAFAVQLVLNGVWPWLFFGLHSPSLGLADIVPQVLALIVTLIQFRRLDDVAGWCLAPPAAWVSFAALLNFAMWRLNAA